MAQAKEVENHFRAIYKFLSSLERTSEENANRNGKALS